MYRTLAVAFLGLAGLPLVPALPAQEKANPAQESRPIELRVLVPAAATLEVQGVMTKQVGPVRNFVSPAVPLGRTYSYTLKATWTEQGKPRTATKTVKFKPSREPIEVDLRKPDAENGGKKEGSKDKDQLPQKGEEKPPKKKTDEEKSGDNGKKAVKDDKAPDVIYWPTPQEVVDKMLDMAKVKKDDILYDLGCGDARIPVTAAKKIGCKAWGFDIDPARIKDSNENVKKNNVGDLVTIRKQDIFAPDFDISKASVVTLYLLPDLNVKLIPKLDKLKPGSRIVSHDFDMEGVKPKEVFKMKAKNHMGQEGEHTIYLWVTPLEKEK
jgi:uncharacterized protein (TIGR03000 family)